jgi:hypothetical protein
MSIIARKFVASLQSDGFIKAASKAYAYLRQIPYQRRRREQAVIWQRKLGIDFPREELQIHRLIANTSGPQANLQLEDRSESGERKSIAVYSTFCGTSENIPKGLVAADSEYDHYFISNNEDVLRLARQRGWIPISLNLEVSENIVLSAHQAKVAKALPHIFRQLAGYQYLFYVDAKISFNTRRLPEFVEILAKSNAPIAVRKHQILLHSNILHEFGEAMQQARYRVQREQTVNYIMEQLRDRFSLECKFLFERASY